MMPPPGVWWQHLFPQTLSSKGVYHLARSRQRWLKDALIRGFARLYPIDWSESLRTRPEDFATFNDFFTRELRAGARPIASGKDVVVAPADGLVSAHGTLRDDTLLQAKGMSYSLAALLGGDERPFRDGEYLTIYLSPPDYHRVHMPIAGTLVHTRYIPGARFNVNARTAAAIPNLFALNERVVCFFETRLGAMAVVLVGALNVSSVSLVSCGEIASGPAREWRDPEPRSLERGDELGRFNLGSTVIVVLAPRMARWDERLGPQVKVSMGESIGRLLALGA
jgi:phosphatidylserine decarboxylase